MPLTIAYPNLADTRSDRWHRLPVIRVAPALNPEKRVTDVVHCGCRERLEVGLRASKPDDGLHDESITAQTGLCNISHNSLFTRAYEYDARPGLASTRESPATDFQRAALSGQPE
jgi:hypothetical protein